jgi:hypothetical protein
MGGKRLSEMNPQERERERERGRQRNIARRNNRAARPYRRRTAEEKEAARRERKPRKAPRAKSIPLEPWRLRLRFALQGWEITRAAADKTIPQTVAAVDRILESDTLQSLAPFATRDSFATAAQLLSRLCKASPRSRADVVGALHSGLSGDLLLLRLARELGAVLLSQRDGELAEPFEPEALRASAAGRVALCAYGEPCAPWRDLSRRERAALALHVLVSEWWGR